MAAFASRRCSYFNHSGFGDHNALSMRLTAGLKRGRIPFEERRESIDQFVNCLVVAVESSKSNLSQVTRDKEWRGRQSQRVFEKGAGSQATPGQFPRRVAPASETATAARSVNNFSRSAVTAAINTPRHSSIFWGEARRRRKSGKGKRNWELDDWRSQVVNYKILNWTGKLGCGDVDRIRRMKCAEFGQRHHNSPGPHASVPESPFDFRRYLRRQPRSAPRRNPIRPQIRHPIARLRANHKVPFVQSLQFGQRHHNSGFGSPISPI
jgi:hypothetical protein